MPQSSSREIESEPALVRLALELGALDVGGELSADERSLANTAISGASFSGEALHDVAEDIRTGGDPLGDILCRIRPAVERRRRGTFYTPPGIVHAMVNWILTRGPARIIDPGCGSGRFSAEIVRRDTKRELWCADIDALQTLLTRAALAVLGAQNAHVVHNDYLHLALPPTEGRSAFICNPPYVRHHGITPTTKAWAARAADALGHSFSGLAGLHAHFFLATAQLGRPGDVGCFITSAEWLDVGYGAVIRSLLVNGLGGETIQVVEPSTAAFGEVQSTAAITCFQLDSVQEDVRIRRVSSLDDLDDLEAGLPIPRSTLARSTRWTPLTRPLRARDKWLHRLGDIVEIHRGLVTGANDFFVFSPERALALGLTPWCVPVISAGKEILESNGTVRSGPARRLLLKAPKGIDRRDFPALDAYLRLGETPNDDPRRVANRYISRHRRPWWFMGEQRPPPIVASYMARQAPMFALNPDGLALLNIGHGLYPREAMSWSQLDSLVTELNQARDDFRGRGRTYQGGLEKFEPREMEALPIAHHAKSEAEYG